MPNPIAGIVGGSVVSGVLGSRASSSAARSQQAAADAATAEQRRQYDLSRSDLAPYRQIGTQAMNQLGSLYGFSPYGVGPAGGAPTDGQAPQIEWRNVQGRLMPTFIGAVANNMRGTPGAEGPALPQPTGMAGFWASPDYNFRRTEGIRGIEQGAAARGGALSGNALRAVTGYSSDLASTEFGNYYNRLANLAGIGQTATNTGVVAGQNFANQAGANAMAAGAARASGTMGAANSWGNAINTGLNLYGMYRGWGVPAGSGGGGGGWGGGR